VWIRIGPITELFSEVMELVIINDDDIPCTNHKCHIRNTKISRAATLVSCQLMH